MTTVIEMHCLVVYDIEADRPRTKISEACLDFGLVRFQKSTFWGKLGPTRRKELYQRLKDIIGSSPGRILIQTVSEDDVATRMVIDNPTEEETKQTLKTPADPVTPPPIVQRF